MNAIARVRDPKAKVVRDRDTFADEEMADLFFGYHLANFPKSGLLDPLSDEGEAHYAIWAKRLLERRVTVTDAMAASERLVSDPPQYPSEHLPAILRVVGAMTAERQEAAEKAARRSVPAAREAEDAELEAIWRSLDDAGRDAIRKAVLDRHPETRAWKRIFRGLCLAELAGQFRDAAASPDDLSRDCLHMEQGGEF